MPLLIRKFGNATRIGTVVLDLEESFQESLTVTWSKERLATGAIASDHSQVEPQVYTITGAVSAIANPFSDPVGFGLSAGAEIADSLSPVDFELNSRWQDAKEDIKAIVRNREEFEYIGAGGRLRLVAEQHDSLIDFDVGDTYQFTLRCFELLRSTVITFGNPTDVGESIAGSGTETAKGPTRLGGPQEVAF